MYKVIRTIDSFNKIIRVIVGISLAVMSIVIVAQVLSRYFFHYTFPWSEELARYLMILTIFLGAALAWRTQSLIGLEIVAEKLSFNKRRILKIGVYLISILFFLILFFLGLSMVESVQDQRSPALQISMSIPYAIIPIGAFVLILNGIAVLFELIIEKEGNTREGEL